MYIPQEQREVVEGIINMMVDKAWEDVSMYDRFADDLRKKSRVLKNREPVQEARIGFYSDKISMREINTEMLEGVMRRLLTDISTEVNNVNEMAKNTALNVIIGAYQAQKGTSSSEKKMTQAALAMQRKQNKDKKKDQNVVHHNTEETGKKAFTRPNQIKQDKPQKSATPSKQSSRGSEKPEEFKKMDPNLCQSNNENPDVMKIEQEFWDRFEV